MRGQFVVAVFGLRAVAKKCFHAADRARTGMMTPGARVRVQVGEEQRSGVVVAVRPGQCRVRFGDAREVWVSAANISMEGAQSAGSGPGSYAAATAGAQENPYAPPVATLTTASPDRNPNATHPGLAAIAKYQRFVNLAILGHLIPYFVGGGLFGALEAMGGPVEIAGLSYLVTWVGTSIFSIYATLGLSKSLYGTLTTVLLCMVSCVPCVSFLVILLMSQRATSVLREAGFKVGLLGADPAQFA